MIFNKENVKTNLFHFYALKGEWEVYNILKQYNLDDYHGFLSIFDDLEYSPLFYALLGGNMSIINDILSKNNVYLTLQDKSKKIAWYENERILSIIFHSTNIEVFKLYLNTIDIHSINSSNVISSIISQIKEEAAPYYYDLFINFLGEKSINMGLDPFYSNQKGENLLYYSILYNQKYIFQKMLDIHLKINMEKSKNPFSFLGFNLSHYTLSEKLRFNNNRVFFIHSLIYQYGVNFLNKPSHNNENLTNIAIETFDEDLLRLLISCGVNTLEKNNIGNTCLHTCVKGGSIYAYKILIDFFSYSTLNIKNDNNETIYDNANIFFKDVLSSRFKNLSKYQEQKLI